MKFGSNFTTLHIQNKFDFQIKKQSHCFLKMTKYCPFMNSKLFGKICFDSNYAIVKNINYYICKNSLNHYTIYEFFF